MTSVETTRDGAPAPARGRRTAAVWGVLAVAGAVLAACGGGEPDAANAGETGPPGPASEPFARVINVEVEPLVLERFRDEIRLTGVARANQDVRVAAEESGVIREILVDRGTSVRQGQPIARIDDDILQAQVEQARAQADLAAQTWERRRRLWEEDRVGSEIAYIEARSAAEQAAASARALEQRLARTTIRAPFSGILDERYVEVGSSVAPGTAVARIVDLDPIKVMAGVPERYAADVRRGTSATVLFNVLPGEMFEAEVGYVGATVNAANRTFPIEIRMPNPGGQVKPEMVANVVVDRQQFEDVVVVPQDALVRVEDGYVAFVAEEGERGMVARVRPVALGASRADRIVVESGLEPGDRLVVVGQKSVADGDRINIVREGGGSR